MLECWRKSRKSGVEHGSVPHCRNWASHEAVRNKHGATKGETNELRPVLQYNQEHI